MNKYFFKLNSFLCRWLNTNLIDLKIVQFHHVTDALDEINPLNILQMFQSILLLTI